jgi:hypothetical protein
MLVQPEQGANVPVRGPTAKARGYSGEEGIIESGTASRKKAALIALPPIREIRSCGENSSDHDLCRVRSIRSRFPVQPLSMCSVPLCFA